MGGIDNEAEDAGEPEPEMSFYQPGASEAESSFATMRALADDISDADVRF
jgi:hypothetical protein